MSGVTGANRIESRADYAQFVKSYFRLISKFPNFVSITPSGSYNSNFEKNSFGDIDLITHINAEDKKVLKTQLVEFFNQQSCDIIVPFSSIKHFGKRTYNSGEIVSIRYHDSVLGYSVQIDNIVALTHKEANFKKQFLDMPAELQGLVLGVVKVAAIETSPAQLCDYLNITHLPVLLANQEYEFNLSSTELQLRKVTYAPNTVKQISKEVVWTSQNFDDLAQLLYQYNLSTNFDKLLTQVSYTIKNPRSKLRISGVFKSMITVKSGEAGTPKGASKINALTKLQHILE